MIVISGLDVPYEVLEDVATRGGIVSPVMLCVYGFRVAIALRALNGDIPECIQSFVTEEREVGISTDDPTGFEGSDGEYYDMVSVEMDNETFTYVLSMDESN